MKILAAFYICCIYSSALQTWFYHGSKHYEPWSEKSYLGPYCLQYWLPKNISNQRADDKSQDWREKSKNVADWDEKFTAMIYMVIFVRSHAFIVCKQRRHRPACTHSQSDQHLCYLLSRKYNSNTCYFQNFKILASLCSSADTFTQYLVVNPKDIFSGRDPYIADGTNDQHWCPFVSLIGKISKHTHCFNTLLHRLFLDHDIIFVFYIEKVQE